MMAWLQGRALMAPYLPRDGASSSPYSEGGALYALGLIHANNGTGIRRGSHCVSRQTPLAPQHLYMPLMPLIQDLDRYTLNVCRSRHNRDFLLESLRATSNETTQHGAALGLGIAGLGSQDEEVFEDLKNVLYTDSAIAGEVHTCVATCISVLAWH